MIPGKNHLSDGLMGGYNMFYGQIWKTTLKLENYSEIIYRTPSYLKHLVILMMVAIDNKWKVLYRRGLKSLLLYTETVEKLTMKC